MTKRNYRLDISYDGTNYSGWQVQKNGVSIQELLEKTLKTILKSDIHVTGSGRTDAGVHAENQVANFTFDGQVDIKRLSRSVNSLLPFDIRVKQIVEVPLDFHARFSPIGKIYHYNVNINQVQNPFKRLYSLHVDEKINFEAIKIGAKEFIGTHDFTSFANQAHLGTASKDPIRTLYRLDIVHKESEICFQLEADGFLYKMVRNIVGTLLDIGKGKLKPDDISKILAAKDRRKAGMAAPPHGLFLMKVIYPDRFTV